MDEQLKFLLWLAERLDEAGIAYMVTGSVALAAYATPRMTRDIDLVVEIDETDVDTIVEIFGGECFLDTDSIRRAATVPGMFNIIHNDSIIKADFVVKKDEVYRVAEFERRRTIMVEGRQVVFVAPEDLILSKLIWGRESGSELQTRDVRDLLDAVKDLDLEYLQRWAAELGVGESLERLREP